MLDWQDIHTVLLDMDGTLLDLHFDNHFWLEHLPKRYAAIHQHSDDSIKIIPAKLDRQPYITSPHQHGAGLWQLWQVGNKLPIPESACIV